MNKEKYTGFMEKSENVILESARLKTTVSYELLHTPDAMLDDIIEKRIETIKTNVALLKNNLPTK